MKVVRLKWNGPIELVGTFSERLREANGFGVYAFTGRHYGTAAESLLYIGKTDVSFYGRNWGEPANRDWLTRMSNHLGASFHYASIEDRDLIKAVETVLIHVHAPPFNSSQIVNPSVLSEHLTIYNEGKLPSNLLPIVATDYPWYGKINPFRMSE